MMRTTSYRRNFHGRDEKGMTLIELMVVVAVVSILVAVMGFQFEGWRARYRMEGELNNIYTDMTDARGRARSRHSLVFVNIPTGDPRAYLVYEDTGNKMLDTAADTLVTNGTSLYEIIPQERQFAINSRGIIEDGTGRLLSSFSLRIDTGDDDPDYDCIVFDSTRVKTGKWNGSDCDAK